MIAYYFEMPWWVRVAGLVLVIAILARLVIRGIGANGHSDVDSTRDELDKAKHVFMTREISAWLIVALSVGIPLLVFTMRRG
jgi:hypothetical protein